MVCSVLAHKSANISETRRDRGKVTMEDIGTHQHSFELYHPRPPIRPHLPQDWGFATPRKTTIAVTLGMGKDMTSHLADTFIWSI